MGLDLSETSRNTDNQHANIVLMLIYVYEFRLNRIFRQEKTCVLREIVFMHALIFLFVDEIMIIWRKKACKSEKRVDMHVIWTFSLPSGQVQNRKKACKSGKSAEMHAGLGSSQAGLGQFTRRPGQFTSRPGAIRMPAWAVHMPTWGNSQAGAFPYTLSISIPHPSTTSQFFLDFF